MDASLPFRVPIVAYIIILSQDNHVNMFTAADKIKVIVRSVGDHLKIKFSYVASTRILQTLEMTGFGGSFVLDFLQKRCSKRAKSSQNTKIPCSKEQGNDLVSLDFPGKISAWRITREQLFSCVKTAQSQ